MCGQGGQVFVYQLLLQRHGGGGDHHPRAPLQGHGNGRGAVSQGFAHAGARLDDGDRGGHRSVGGAVFALGGFAQVGVGKGVGHLGGHLPLASAGPQMGLGGDHVVKGLEGVRGPCGSAHKGREKQKIRPCGPIYKD